ncbi:hypothetical protein RFI_17973 [Reticulomyxa filosa]|uniref:Uncharacterized protein n=1 Tax=Reticulomyxa filosa TaxID=46433 RepID=X6N029_RETFI|nr:hypothetical protein RFI_17973 [Reticulomyxa filosa]|eukprot:ETO19258.1 hypothetical protein RFI_17973 [Reticulomyxa filosa]
MKKPVPFPYVTPEDIEKQLKMTRRGGEHEKAGGSVTAPPTHGVSPFASEKPKAHRNVNTIRSRNDGASADDTATHGNCNSCSSISLTNSSATSRSNSIVSSVRTEHTPAVIATVTTTTTTTTTAATTATTTTTATAVAAKENTTKPISNNNETTREPYIEICDISSLHDFTKEKDSKRTLPSNLFDPNISLDDLKMIPTQWNTEFFLENIVPSQADLTSSCGLFDNVLPTWEEVVADTNTLQNKLPISSLQTEEQIAMTKLSKKREKEKEKDKNKKDSNYKAGNLHMKKYLNKTSASSSSSFSFSFSSSSSSSSIQRDDQILRMNLVVQAVEQLSKQSLGGNPTREEVAASIRRNYPSIEDKMLMGGVSTQNWIATSIEYALFYGLVEEYSGRLSTPVVSPEIVNFLRGHSSDVNHISKHLQEHASPEISELCGPSNVFNICYKCRHKFSICEDDKMLSKKCFMGTSNDIGIVRIRLRSKKLF